MHDEPISRSDRQMLRELACRVAEAAADQRMVAVRKRWHDVNGLRRPDRAPVWCRPVGAWSEILPDAALKCSSAWARSIEKGFRQTLFKVELGDDTPVPASFDVQAEFDVSPANTWGVGIRHRSSGQPGGAWAFDPPLKAEADFDRLELPTWAMNRPASDRAASRADELLGDILPVRLVCRPPFDSATLGHIAADLRGLEQMMIDMTDRPVLMHRLMSHLRDARLRWLDTMELSGLLVANTDEPMICSGPIGPVAKTQPRAAVPQQSPLPNPPPAGEGKEKPGAAVRPTLANCWCAGNSQEFDGVSPGMWREFCLEYQRPIFARFALACYGCCENLARKIDGVLTIPNLRIFVCSAWTTLVKALERVPRDYCIMWRQKATNVVMPDDVESIRADLLDGARRLQGRPYQIVLRELETLAGHPDRLHVWARLAIEAAERYA